MKSAVEVIHVAAIFAGAFGSTVLSMGAFSAAIFSKSITAASLYCLGGIVMLIFTVGLIGLACTDATP